MGKVYFVFMTIAVLFLNGCSNDSDVLIPDKKIGLKTSIAAETIMKTSGLNEDGSGNFMDGDIFTFHVSTPGGQMTVVDYKVGHTELYWKNISMNADDQTVNFAACYPKQNIINGQFTFDLEKAEDKDLLLAYKKGIPVETETPVNLVFKHAMHRLVVNYTTESDVNLSEVETRCVAKSTCNLDLVAGTLDNSASEKASFFAKGKKAEFLIVPQSTSDVVLEVTSGPNVKTFTIKDISPKYDNLEGGMQLTVDLIVKKGSIELGGIVIEGWGDQGTIEGEIII